MENALWTAQYIAAGIFFLSGLTKALVPKWRLEPKMPWMKDFNPGTVRFIGVAELLGAAGLLAPGILHYAVVLTPLAAIGLALVMLLATNVHLARKEYALVAVNVTLLALTAFIAWGRLTHGWPAAS